NLQLFPEQLAQVREAHLALAEAEDDLVRVLREDQFLHELLTMTLRTPGRWACWNAATASSSAYVACSSERTSTLFSARSAMAGWNGPQREPTSVISSTTSDDALRLSSPA